MLKRTVTYLDNDMPVAKKVRTSAKSYKSKGKRKSKKFGNPYFDEKVNTVEAKYVISNSIADNPSGVVNQNPRFVLLNGMGSGTFANNQRVGNKVCVNSFQIKGVFGNTVDNLTALETANYSGNVAVCMRVALVFDKQANGAAPAAGQIWNTANCYSLRNQDWIERFDVLMDEHITICSAGPNCVNIDKFIKMAKEVTYTGSPSGIASIATGALWLVYFTNQAASPDDSNFVYYWQMKFHDA